MDLGLEGTSVLVTGASRGIGLATAAAFLSEGANVAITGRDEIALESAASQLLKRFPGRRVLAIAGDGCDRGAVAAAVNATAVAFGGLDCAVANVGHGTGPAGWDVDEDSWRALLDQNLLSAALLSQTAIPAMAHGGALVLIASIAGLGSLPAPLPYSASKAALVRYARDLARQTAPLGIRVNAVAPGNVLFAGGRWAERVERDPAGVERLLEAEVPMRRFGTPDEIADAVVFLASERAAFVTGACLVVDGGQLRD